MHSFIRLAAVTTLLGATGCYMAGDDDLVDGSTEGLSEAGGGDNGSATGPVSGGRDIIEADGFKLYWEHYDAWEQGACTRLRLKNEGGEVRGWEMNLQLSENVTDWIDSGGAFMWLVDDQLTVEQEDFSDFESWESVEMYFCAEPAVEIDDFQITWREGEDRGPDVDETEEEEELPSVSGTLEFDQGDGHSAALTYESYVNGGYTCLNFDVENTSEGPAAIFGFDLQLSNRTDFVYASEGIVVEDSSDTLSFIFDDRSVLEVGEKTEGRVCMTAMAEPEELASVIFGD